MDACHDCLRRAVAGEPKRIGWQTRKRAVTIVDVASRAGVAISTASVALNGRPGVSNSTRQRVREVADELGFIASVRGKSLSAKRAFALGLAPARHGCPRI
jgi:Bacterial regulatory proteins, lacI family